jgi:transcriptional regulator with XRE-family HTH domain
MKPTIFDPAKNYSTSNMPPGFDPRTMNVVNVLRVASGKTQRALAKSVGVTPALIGYWESGRALPGPATTPRLAAELKIDPVSLVAWLTVYVPPAKAA